MKRKKWALLGLAVAVIVSASAVGFYVYQKNQIQEEVPVLPEGMELSESVVTASGLTSAGMAQESYSLGFLENGLYVEETCLSIGEEAEAGTAVFKVSEESLENARTELEKAVTEAQLNSREGRITLESGLIDAEETKELADAEATWAQTTYDNAVADAQAELDSLQEQVDDAQEKVDEYTASIEEDYYAEYYQVAELEETWKDYAAFLAQLYQEWDVAALEDVFGGSGGKNGVGYVTNQVSASSGSGSSSGMSAAGSSSPSGASSSGSGSSSGTSAAGSSSPSGASSSGSSSSSVSGASAAGSGSSSSVSGAASSGSASSGSAPSGSFFSQDSVVEAESVDSTVSQYSYYAQDSAEAAAAAETESTVDTETAAEGESNTESSSEESNADTSGGSSDADGGSGENSGTTGDASGSTSNDGSTSGMTPPSGSFGTAGAGFSGTGTVSGNSISESGMGQAGTPGSDEIRYNIYLAMVEEADEAKELYDEAEENYETAKETAAAGLGKAKSELTVLQAKLAEQQISYQKAVLEAQNTYEQALANQKNAQLVYETTVKSLEEDYQTLQDAEETAQEHLELFEEQIGDGTFYTTKSGTVVMTNVRAGSWLTEDLVVLAFNSPETISVAANVSQSDIASISIGEEALVVISGYGVFDATVTSFNPVSESSGSTPVTYTVNVELQGDCSELESNLTAYVYFGLTEEEKTALTNANSGRMQPGSGQISGNRMPDGAAGSDENAPFGDGEMPSDGTSPFGDGSTPPGGSGSDAQLGGMGTFPGRAPGSDSAQTQNQSGGTPE